MTRAATEQSPAQLPASGAPETLKRRADFVRLAKGFRKTCDGFVLQALPSDHPAPRVGLTITKKVGNAPERNRIRRRLRAAVRLSAKDAGPNDFVIVARRSLLSMPFPLLTRDLAEAMTAISGRIEHRQTRSGA